MMTQSTLRRGFGLAVFAVVLTLVATGCGGSKSGPVDQPMRLALEDFREFLKNLPTDNLKPPKDLATFMPLEPMAPVAAEYLVRGDLVYLWGADLVEGGERIVAHQKTADADGYWVLRESGKVEKLSADKFSQAPKAK